MKQIILSARLKAAAKYIKNDAAIADVGTDHGYIPVYLAQNDIARRIIATDIKKGPLARAQASAREYGVSNRIEFVQSDGLDGLDGSSLDTVVIAGMGGETIAGILQNAPWTKNVRLILQPQSKLNELLAWLKDNGYHIDDASIALDDDRLYTVISLYAKESNASTDFYRTLLDKHEPLLPEYLAGLIEKTRRAIEGLEKAENAAGDELKTKKRELEELIDMKEETDRWQM